MPSAMPDEIPPSLPSWAADALRAPVASRAGSRDAIMQAVRRIPAPRRLSAPAAVRASRWLRRGSLSGAGGVLLTAMLAFMVSVHRGDQLAVIDLLALLGQPAVADPPGSQAFWGREPAEAYGRALLALIRRATGIDMAYEILSIDEWVAHRVVASRYRDRRVFLAGDACHLHPPYGGFGMNMGVSDVVDLGWKLAAVLQGWGGETLLQSYERERRPVDLDIALQVERPARVDARLSAALAHDVDVEVHLLSPHNPRAPPARAATTARRRG